MTHCHVLVITGQCVPTLHTENPSILGCDATVLDYLTLKMKALRSFETCELFAQRLSNTAVSTVKTVLQFLASVWFSKRHELHLFVRRLIKSELMYCTARDNPQDNTEVLISH